jgi:hypothetical protein
LTFRVTADSAPLLRIFGGAGLRHPGHLGDGAEDVRQVRESIRGGGQLRDLQGLALTLERVAGFDLDGDRA